MSPKTKIRWQEVAPRMLADYLILHCAMLMALATSIIYQTGAASADGAPELVGALRQYYFSWFLGLSLVFPVVFFLNGIYTHVRYYAEWRKLQRFVVVVFLSFAVFITANYFFLPSGNPIGRSAAVSFTVFAFVGLVGVRVAKEWIVGKERRAIDARRRTAETGPVLVIGGAGYIGSWLAKRLLEEGQSVRILDNAVYGLEPIRDLLGYPKFNYVNGDCRNIQDVVKAMRGVSSVVHLAAIVGDPACELDHKTTIEINYAATRMLIEIAKGYGVDRFLFASSCSVYGASDELMSEASSIAPISLYGETKVSSERALLEAAGDDFHPVLMRFATVFGLSNRPRFDLVVNLLSAKAKQHGAITIFNGEQWRPFVHVKDLANSMLLLLNAPRDVVSRQIFNVGDNRLNYRLSDVATVIQHVFPGTRVEYVDNTDKRNYRVNFDKIRQSVGFECRLSLEDGVREIKAALESDSMESYDHYRFNNLVFLRESGTPENKSEFDGEIMAAFGGERIRRLALAPEASAEKARAKGAGSH
jgi:nucleoside-diphosphate-sugar epimerase